MDLHLWLVFLGAVTVLMLIPGPNVALIVANSVSFGARHGLVTVAGTSAANGIQVALAGLGLSTALGQFGSWFGELRWLGVAYLVYSGIRQWRAEPVDLSLVAPEAGAPGRTFRRAFAVSLTNPKTLFFYGAFFPQFISTEAPPAPQVMILVATLLVTAVLIDSTWALVASRARAVLARHGRIRNRVTGGLMVGAGATLAMAHHT